MLVAVLMQRLIGMFMLTSCFGNDVLIGVVKNSHFSPSGLNILHHEALNAAKVKLSMIHKQKYSLPVLILQTPLSMLRPLISKGSLTRGQPFAYLQACCPMMLHTWNHFLPIS